MGVLYNPTASIKRLWLHFWPPFLKMISILEKVLKGRNYFYQVSDIRIEGINDGLVEIDAHVCPEACLVACRGSCYHCERSQGIELEFQFVSHQRTFQSRDLLKSPIRIS